MIIGFAATNCEFPENDDINSFFRFFWIMDVNAPDSVFSSWMDSDSLMQVISGDPVTDIFSLSLSKSGSSSLIEDEDISVSLVDAKSGELFGLVVLFGSLLLVC